MSKTAGQRLDENRLEAALSNLNRRIDAGEEFPDACWAAASAFNTPYEKLQQAYDDQPEFQPGYLYRRSEGE